MELLREAIRRVDAGQALALATVVACDGSTPRHPGAKMLVAPDGVGSGTIGGGRIEQEVVAAARAVAAGQPARRVRHHLVRDLAMCCGGSMDLYLEPVGPSRDALAAAVAEYDRRRPCLLVTPLDGSAKSVELLAAASGRAPAPRCDASRFLEPVWPAARLILFGAGHVARALAPRAAEVGFQVVVCDDDETRGLAQPVAGAGTAVESFELADVERALGPLGPGDYVVILTRDHAIDQRILEQVLGREPAYLGLIGSLGKVGRFRRRLEAKGLATPERWSKLRAPVGLDIAAETPAEIAVAVVAELILTRNRAPAS